MQAKDAGGTLLPVPVMSARRTGAYVCHSSRVRAECVSRAESHAREVVLARVCNGRGQLYMQATYKLGLPS